MEGLTCLRKQLTGDELLMWTVETFTMFYDKTFAAKTVIPLLGLVPLLLSIATFVYDYYSDIELTLEYYSRSSFNATPGTNVTPTLLPPGAFYPDHHMDAREEQRGIELRF